MARMSTSERKKTARDARAVAVEPETIESNPPGRGHRRRRNRRHRGCRETYRKQEKGKRRVQRLTDPTADEIMRAVRRANRRGGEQRIEIRATPTTSGRCRPWVVRDVSIAARCDLTLAVVGGRQVVLQGPTDPPLPTISAASPSSYLVVKGNLSLQGAQRFGAVRVAAGPGHRLVMIGVDVRDNRSESSGGGVYTEGSATLLSCVVANNAARFRGGGVWAGAGLLLSQATQVVDNVVAPYKSRGDTAGENDESEGGDDAKNDVEEAPIRSRAPASSRIPSSESADVSSAGAGRGDGGVPGGAGAYVGGGGLVLSGSSVVARNVVVGRKGRAGGAWVARGATVLSEASAVDRNAAFDVGGIYQVDGDLSLLGGSSASGNESSNASEGTSGGGGIVIERGDVLLSRSRVCDNRTDGMYSGGIVSLRGDVSVMDGSEVSRNRNRGPGGGIACNLASRVVVDASRICDNVAASLGGGIVNFSPGTGGRGREEGAAGKVIISNGSVVAGNVVTDAQDIGGTIDSFLSVVLDREAVAEAREIVSRLEDALREDASSRHPHPCRCGDRKGLVAGGGVASFFDAPVEVIGGSVVANNRAGVSSEPGSEGGERWSHRVVSIGGGIFAQGGALAVSRSEVVSNASLLSGGGVWSGERLIATRSSFVGNRSRRCGSKGAGIRSLSREATVLCSVRVTDNATPGRGGGIAATGRLDVIRSLVCDNKAKGGGGGILCDPPRTALLRSVVKGNTPDNIRAN